MRKLDDFFLNILILDNFQFEKRKISSLQIGSIAVFS